MFESRLVFASLLISAAVGCRTNESEWGDVLVDDFSAPIDATAMDEVRGTWSGTLLSDDDQDELGIAGAEVIAVVRVLSYDVDDAELDMSFRFDLDEWMTGIGTGGLMSNDVGDFSVVVHGNDSMRCLVEGDWTSGTESVYIEFNCTDTSGSAGVYQLVANRF